MDIKQQDNNLLVNEWQLGQQLSTAVHTGTRDKFNLLLSFLSDDARDFAQFSLPDQPLLDLTPKSVDFRSVFSLAEQQPLVNKGMSSEQAESLNTSLHQNRLNDIRLQLLLSNDPLLSRNGDQIIDRDVMDNLGFVSQLRLQDAINKDKEEQEQVEVEKNAISGIDAQLMAQYQAMDFDNKPVKVTYM